jgi:hypothetical protein
MNFLNIFFGIVTLFLVETFSLETSQFEAFSLFVLDFFPNVICQLSLCFNMPFCLIQAMGGRIEAQNEKMGNAYLA